MSLENGIIFTTAQSAGTGNVIPLLHEIRHALARLWEQQEETVIDLRRIPLNADEETRLSTFLGTGEVQATINAAGLTEIQETSYSGVWIETHHNSDGEILGKYISVSIVPAMLRAQPEEIQSSSTQLNDDLQRLSDSREAISNPTDS